MFNKVWEEIESENPNIETSIIEKTAFNINLDPATMISSITGALVGRKMAKNQIFKKQQAENDMKLGNNYYSEVENVSKNLKVVFTPFSAVYVLNFKNRDIGLDTISTDQMNGDMKKAWEVKDDNYFKNLMVNKMTTEMQLAEQMYARRMVEHQNQMQRAMGKQSSEEIELLNTNALIDNVCGLKRVFEKNASSNMGTILCNMMESNGEVELSWKLGEDICKEASVFSGALNFLGLSSPQKQLRQTQKDFLNPKFLNKNIRIGFLPDRVLFIVNNLVVTQLPSMDMNEEGFERFSQKDIKYFEKMFSHQMGGNKGFGKFAATEVIEESEMVKLAYETGSMNDIFSLNGIHPKIYYSELTKTMGIGWLDYSVEVLIDEIERIYELREVGISNIPLNKILIIQLLNKSSLPFESAFIFEKCARALSDKLIDFDKWESSVDVSEVLLALQLMDELTPDYNIFEDMSGEVIHYIAKSLFASDTRSLAVRPSFINSEPEATFFEKLNRTLLAEWIRELTIKLSEEDVVTVTSDCHEIANVSMALAYDFFTSEFPPASEIQSAVEKACSAREFNEKNMKATLRDVQQNLSIDMKMTSDSAKLASQLELYKL